MAQNVFTYICEDSFIDQGILQLANAIYRQCALKRNQIQEKSSFQFIIYNDSIAVLVTKAYGCQYFHN